MTESPEFRIESMRAAVAPVLDPFDPVAPLRPDSAPVSLARAIDHTLLKPEATPAQIETLCAEALQYNFASVCVNSVYVPLCASLLRDAVPAVCTVVGFPLGASLSSAKVAEALAAIEAGAREIDMVLHIGALKAGDYAALRREIGAVVSASHEGGALCKVIIETGLLTDDEKIAACLIAAHAGADFVKTSTGFSGGGATPADVALMRRTVGATVGVKASGGVRSYADAQSVIEAGASRIGASAGVAILTGATGTATY